MYPRFPRSRFVPVAILMLLVLAVAGGTAIALSRGSPEPSPAAGVSGGLPPEPVPNLINFQGSLGDADGNPINGSVAVTFRIYDVPVGGIPLLEESHNVTVQDGLFSVLLGSATLGGLDPTVFTNPELHLETEVDGEVLEPRQRIASVPFAMVAGRAETAGSADTAGYAIDADNLDGFDSSEFARAAAVDGVQGAVDAEAAARQAADAQL